MDEPQHIELLFVDLLYQLLILLVHNMGGGGLSKDSGQKREELHLLSLIIQELSLFPLSTDVSELSSDDRVAEAN